MNRFNWKLLGMAALILAATDPVAVVVRGDRCRGTLVSAGATYELPVGSKRALQGLGDGEFNLFVTAGQRLYGENAHWLTSLGYRLPVDNNVSSSSV